MKKSTPEFINEIVKAFYAREARSDAQKNRGKNKSDSKRDNRTSQKVLPNGVVKGGEINEGSP